jgi:hypothetical protein
VGLFSVNKSASSTNNATTNNYDQRQVNDASGGGIVGNGNSIDNSKSWFDLTSIQSTQNNVRSDSTSNSGNTSNSDNTSANWFDLSNKSTNTSDSNNTSAAWTDSRTTSSVDNSNHAMTTNYTSTGTDPGVSSINGTNAALLATLGSQQGDAMKVIAGLGATGIRQMGESATNLFGQAEQNSAQVWTNTINASQDAMDRMFSAASGVLGASTQLANGAMQTYQPADSKASDNQTKIAIIGVIAIIVAAFIQARKG